MLYIKDIKPGEKFIIRENFGRGAEIIGTIDEVSEDDNLGLVIDYTDEYGGTYWCYLNQIVKKV